MSFSLLGHIAIGTLAWLLYWIAFSAPKGSGLHRAAGKICLALLVLTGLSVGPVLFARPGPFDPGVVVQMVYLTACLTTVSWLAFAAIRWKSDVERFRGRFFRVSGPGLLALGIVVLVAGIAKSDPVPVVLSWVGLVYGGAMIAFSRSRAPVHPRWWMVWHLHAVSGLLNAVNGTLLYVVLRFFDAVPAGSGPQAACQLLTIAAALAMRVWFGRTFRAPLVVFATAEARRAP